MLLLVDMNSQELGNDEFVKPIAKLLADFEVKHHSEVQDVERYDKIIISGTALKDMEYAKRDFSWLKDCGNPVLGICAGMQVIATALGAELVECTEIGMTKIKTLEENPLFNGEFEAYELHNYSVTKGNFEVLAESENCIQAIRKEKLFGVMFHPEVRNNKVIQKFCEL